MKNKLKKVFSILFTVVKILVPPLAVILLFITLEHQGFFNVDKIEIQVNLNLEQKMFIVNDLQLIERDINTVKGHSLVRVGLKDIQLDLKKYPWIDTFRISKSWPSNLKIEITPFKIPMIVQSSSKSFVPVTASGELLKEIRLTEAPDVVVATQKKLLTDKIKREKALWFVSKLPDQGVLSQATVAGINLLDNDGFELQLMATSTKVILGEEDLENKINKASQVLDYIEKKQLKAKLVDANSGKKIIVRLHDGSVTEVIK